MCLPELRNPADSDKMVPLSIHTWEQNLCPHCSGLPRSTPHFQTPPPPHDQHRRPDTLDCLLQGSKYRTRPEQADQTGGDDGSACQGLGKGEGGERWPPGPGFPLG